MEVTQGMILRGGDETIIHKKLIDVLCNKCGVSLMVGHDDYTGVIEAIYELDGEHSFSLCLPCLCGLVQGFKHKPEALNGAKKKS